MWIQAAATMAQYDLVSSASLASAPQTESPPQILKPIQSSDSSDTGGSVQDIVDNDAGNPYDLSWWMNRITEPIDTLERTYWNSRRIHPERQRSWCLTLRTHSRRNGPRCGVYEAFFPEINALALTVSAANPGFLAGFGGTGCAGWDSAGRGCRGGHTTPETASVPVTTTSNSSVVSAAAAQVPRPPPRRRPDGHAHYGACAGSPIATARWRRGGRLSVPGRRSDRRSRHGMSTGAQRKAPEPDIAAAAAAVTASAQAKKKARRRLRAGMRGHGDEFMDMNVEVEPDWAARLLSSWSRRPLLRIRVLKIWGSRAQRGRRPWLRRRVWPRWPVASSAAGRQFLWCRAPGSRETRSSAKGRSTRETPHFDNEKPYSVSSRA